MQYTIRRIPPDVDAALRRRAAVERRSLNEVAVEALARGLGATFQRGGLRGSRGHDRRTAPGVRRKPRDRCRVGLRPADAPPPDPPPRP